MQATNGELLLNKTWRPTLSVTGFVFMVVVVGCACWFGFCLPCLSFRLVGWCSKPKKKNNTTQQAYKASPLSPMLATFFVSRLRSSCPFDCRLGWFCLCPRGERSVFRRFVHRIYIHTHTHTHTYTYTHTYTHRVDENRAREAVKNTLERDPPYGLFVCCFCFAVVVVSFCCFVFFFFFLFFFGHHFGCCCYFVVVVMVVTAHRSTREV